MVKDQGHWLVIESVKWYKVQSWRKLFLRHM